ncbi:hypothetical protein KR222_004133 [Zaprionus bogoriensis]|nr:hypothetical protein KR222_004133 [Zaprionus bogoriensis]
MPPSAQFLRNLQRFRLVTFDVTDTLIRLRDPMGQYIRTAAACGAGGLDENKMASCFRQQFKRMSAAHTNFGRHTPGMSWQAWWLQLVTQTFACVDASLPPAQVQTIAAQLLDLFRTSAAWAHVDGAAELVQCVHDAGKCVGIISNFDPSLPTVLEAMGFGGQFDFILTSHDAGVMKPAPGIFEIPVRHLGIAPAQALHIGNKLDMDYTGARNSGWSGLLVQPETEPQTQPQPDAAAQHTFASLAEMLQALQCREIAW